MIKCLIITHGNLGNEMIKVSEKIMEKKIDIDCMGFDWQEDGRAILNRLEAYLTKNKGHQTLIFTDMFGGSPSNICLRFLNPNIEVITGINLPGMIKYLTHKDKNMDFKEIIQIVKKGMIDGINIMGEYIGEKKK